MLRTFREFLQWRCGEATCLPDELDFCAEVETRLRHARTVAHASNWVRLMDKVTDQCRNNRRAAYRNGNSWQVAILGTLRSTACLANVATATEAWQLVNAIAVAGPYTVAGSPDANGLEARKR